MRRTAALLLAALPIALSSTNSLASDKLIFEMAGSTNWAIADFCIAIGRVSESTRRTIYVTPETYAQISSLVSSVGTIAAPANKLVFAVTQFKNSSTTGPVLVSDRSVVDIMGKIASMSEVEHQPVPAIVSEIASTFASGR